MELKKFDLYTKEEQKTLLLHWWSYYGKLIVTLDECEKFEKLIDEDSILMKDVALLSYLFNQSSQALIRAMRDGSLEMYLQGVKKFISSPKLLEEKEYLEGAFLEELVGTFNKPEKPVDMGYEEILSQIFNIFDEEKIILTGEKVISLYKSCLVGIDEISNDMPTLDFVIGEGVNYISLFSAARLEEKKGEIIQLIDQLPKINEGNSFLAMCNDKNGRQWTDDQRTMDVLIQLGIASGTLNYSLPREDWDNLPGGMPYIIRNKENDSKKVSGKKPIEYQKTLREVKERLNK